jgi:hypothetical protein
MRVIRCKSDGMDVFDGEAERTTVANYHLIVMIYTIFYALYISIFFDMRYISIMFMRDRPSELMNHFLVSWTRNTAYFAQHVYSLGPLSFYLQVV